jgi:hypothetical protein
MPSRRTRRHRFKLGRQHIFNPGPKGAHALARCMKPRRFTYEFVDNTRCATENYDIYDFEGSRWGAKPQGVGSETLHGELGLDLLSLQTPVGRQLGLMIDHFDETNGP